MKAAVVKNKAVVSVSDCPIHPKYQALQPPTSKKEGCVCQEIYNTNHPAQNVISMADILGLNKDES